MKGLSRERPHRSGPPLEHDLTSRHDNSRRFTTTRATTPHDDTLLGFVSHQLISPRPGSALVFSIGIAIHIVSQRAGLNNPKSAGYQPRTDGGL